MIPHFLATYDDGYIKNTFCKLCGKEGMELIGSDCPGAAPEEKKPLIIDARKFVSGLPDWD